MSRTTANLVRALDIVFAFVGLVVASPLLIVLGLIGVLDTGSPLFFQRRVGRRQVPFTLVKFRTMKVGTVSVASHLADPSAITSFGRFLRKTKLDELPQLWNVMIGQMSMVGPRPCLYSQSDLIRERELRDVFNIRPGVTGLAQVMQIDMATPVLLAETDQRLLREMSVAMYLRLIWQTIIGRGSGDRVRQTG
jgi:O-antigen biosynthesis protein WbqP